MFSFKRFVIPIVLIFAFIGLSYRLLTNPLGLLSSALMGIGIIAVIFFVLQRVMGKRHSGLTRAQLSKVKRTSKIKRKKEMNATKKKVVRRMAVRKNEHNLTVIEGKRNSKKKNRALF